MAETTPTEPTTETTADLARKAKAKYESLAKKCTDMQLAINKEAPTIAAKVKAAVAVELGKMTAKLNTAMEEKRQAFIELQNIERAARGKK